MELTPRFDQLKKENPRAHSALATLACAIFEEEAEPLLHSKAEKIKLDPALFPELLKTDGGGITFAQPDLRDEYLIRHSVMLAHHSWADLEKFARTFDKVRRLQAVLNLRQDFSGLVLVILARGHKKDVIERISEVARRLSSTQESNWLFWCLNPGFCEALPNLPFEAERLADSLGPVLEVGAKDSMGGLIFGAVQKLAARSQATADSLYQSFISRPEPVIALAANALISLAEFDLPEAHRRGLALTGSEQPERRKVGIAVLGRLDYREQRDLLQVTLKRLKELRTSGENETGYVLVQAYGDLLGQTEEAPRGLVELAIQSDPSILHNLARVLQGNQNKLDQPWYSEALQHLARATAREPDLLQSLDYSTVAIAKKNPDLAMSILSLGVPFRDEGDKTELPKKLQVSFDTLHNSYPDKFEALLTQWFAASETRLHRAASQVLLFYNRGRDRAGQPEIKLSKQVLDRLEDRTVFFLLQRLMGYLIGGRQLSALLISALQREPVSEALTRFVAEALQGYVLYNYPVKAGDFLEGICEASPGTLSAAVAQAAIEKSQLYYNRLRDLPKMKEFIPPSRRVHLLQVARIKLFQRAMENKSRKSPLLSLVSRIPLKYGRSFFSRQEGEFTSPHELKEYSQEVESPRCSVIDPLGIEYQRMEWRLAGLNDAKFTPREADRESQE